MSSSLLLMEPIGGSFGRFLPVWRGAQVVATGGLDLPGSCGPSLFATGLLSDDEEALTLRPECVTQRFLLLTSLSPGGELSVVFRLPTVSFRWLDAIQNYLPLLYQMIGFGKVLDSVVIPAKGIRTGCPDAPSDGFVSHARSSSPYGRLSETVVGDAAVRDRGKEIRMMAIRLIMRATCHCEMRATCFSEEDIDTRSENKGSPIHRKCYTG
ncbi:hypothetical protein AAG906_003778 [Vitis piasezkii]